jgi:hypothetical protein
VLADGVDESGVGQRVRLAVEADDCVLLGVRRLGGGEGRQEQDAEQ